MTVQKPLLLILGASKEMLPLMEIARNDGYMIAATDRDPAAPGLALADFPFPADVGHNDTLIELMNALNPVGVLTRVELLLPQMARACKQFGLPGPSEQVALLSVDKHLFRHTIHEAGLSTPRFAEVTMDFPLHKALDHTLLPAIVKPVDYSGSTGVKKVSSYDEAEDALKTAMNVSPSGRVIVEEYLAGREFSVETWSQFGETHIAAITEKRVSDNGHFVELQHIIPADINTDERLLVETEVQKMAKAMSLNDCLTHTEVMLTRAGAVLIETGARPGGDMIGLTLVEMATGISMNQIMLYLALGKPVPPMPLRPGAAAIRFLTSDNIASLQRIHDSLLKDPNFAGYEILRSDDPGKLESSADRVAYFLFRAEDRQSLLKTLSALDE